MDKILIPIDFSESADRVLSAAKIIADKASTELLILHAYQPYIADATGMSSGILPGVGAPDFLSLTSELENDLKLKFESYVDALKVDGYHATSLWDLGGVDEVIKDAVVQHQPDMIVMGRTGSGGFLDKLIGSTATAIALHVPCPVMIIPPQSTPRKFREVVYATQLEYSEIDILRKVFVLINHLGGRLSLLKVRSDTQPDVQPDHQYLKEIRATFDIPDQDIVIREAKHIAEGIEHYCDEIAADLLIVSAREQSFIEEFLINPSISKKLVINTHIPLLVFHLKET